MDILYFVVGLVVAFSVVDYIRFRGIGKVTTAEAKELIAKKDKDNVFIDVREPMEVSQQKIKGFTNIPLMDLKQRLNQFKKEQKIYIICHSGSRSKNAAKAFYKSGYKNVFIIKGGASQW